MLELRNRVKVLQGKLDKQKELTNTLEESLRAHPKPQEKAVAIDTGPGAEASTSKSSKVCTTHFKLKNTVHPNYSIPD